MDQLGFLVYFSREGNSACLVAHLGSLVCFFRPEKSVYLMDQLESLVCLSPEREKKMACLVEVDPMKSPPPRRLEGFPLSDKIVGR